MNTIKIENVKCNGLTGGYGNATLSVRGIIQTAISVFRMRHDDILEMMPHGNYYPGPRFKDDERVTDRICSGLYEAAIQQVTNTSWPAHNASPEQFVEIVKVIENTVNSISGKEMDALILEGMRDCAEADHWYQFEKQWD
jgi:hypothetical protein